MGFGSCVHPYNGVMYFVYILTNEWNTTLRWRKKWKTQLIEKGNPYWKDLFDTLEGGSGGSS